MSSYYQTFFDALLEGDLERRTDFSTGHEALYRKGQLIACDSNDIVENPSLTETIMLEPHIVLFGAGHVGKALYDLAVLQNLKVTVFDSRAELLTEQRFSKATRIADSYDNALSKEYDFVSPYYTIFTHGHVHDTECLYYALTHKHSYVGMIGSKGKVAYCLEQVKAKGITDEQLKKLHSPIGLSINAVTPQEIAISIMAQIISIFRADKHTITIDSPILQAAAKEKGIMVRIIEKNGSAPRSVGSMMFVTQGKIYGTVGGGAIENHAIETAYQMLGNKEKLKLEHHVLTGNEELGMNCGGKNTLLYKYIE